MRQEERRIGQRRSETKSLHKYKILSRAAAHGYDGSAQDMTVVHREQTIDSKDYELSALIEKE